MTHLLVFDWLRPRNVLHTFAPNGHTGLRFDSAVATGLARRVGSRCVGYQNRATYDSVYEDGFDCYDTYLAWGEKWREILPAGTTYIERLVPVGCIENEGRAAQIPPHRNALTVSIFTSDIRGDMFSTAHVVSLIVTCMELARRFPHCRFQVKTKDPQDVDLVMADPLFQQTQASIGCNLEFLRLPRHDVGQTIAASDIVIASAWTTPGSIALTLERRVLFFNPTGGGGAPFEDLPDLIASSPAELQRLFEVALTDYREYGRTHSATLARLDPFRDGHPISRVLDELLNHSGG